MAYSVLETKSEYLQPKEAAARLGIHPKAIYDLIAHGRIIAVDVSPDPNARRHTYRIAEAEIERFLRGNTTVRHPAVRQTRTRNQTGRPRPLKSSPAANDSE